jgi:hypothetical protein
MPCPSRCKDVRNSAIARLWGTDVLLDHHSDEEAWLKSLSAQRDSDERLNCSLFLDDIALGDARLASVGLWRTCFRVRSKLTMPLASSASNGFSRHHLGGTSDAHSSPRM